MHNFMIEIRKWKIRKSLFVTANPFNPHYSWN